MHLTFELQQFLCVMVDRGWKQTLRFKWQLKLFGKIEWSQVYLLCSLTVDDKIVDVWKRCMETCFWFLKFFFFDCELWKFVTSLGKFVKNCVFILIKGCLLKM